MRIRNDRCRYHTTSVSAKFRAKRIYQGSRCVTLYNSVALSYIAAGVVFSVGCVDTNRSVNVEEESVGSIICGHGVRACASIRQIEIAALGDVGVHLV